MRRTDAGARRHTRAATRSGSLGAMTRAVMPAVAVLYGSLKIVEDLKSSHHKEKYRNVW